MKARLALLGLAGAAGAFGQYTYEPDSALYVFSATTYSSRNGSASWSDFRSVSYPCCSNSVYLASPGSFIYTPTVSGANPNDYEVNTTLTLGTGGGTYINYLRATANAMASPGACAGSYIDVEIAVPSTYV